MKKTRDFLFATLVFSVGVFVSVMFWSLWAINRELIFPKIFDRFFPSWLNHNIHTVPLLGVLMESWITFHNFPTRRQGYITIAFAIGISFLAFKTGVWVYPILQKLSLIGRAAFMVGMAFLTILFYVLGEYISCLFWGEEIRSIQMRKIH
ncbi:Androgen-dependent TFPI-regulating protein [Armadillidium nasatum]|uniref:Androgen-dependent TFPI-regulating protein n=1 Tax=Armadillidium nasatum TaxID=96803 RepID=A0A5N5TIF7_9CRUS|nr:Androgen-dependent TFPI-regulating protein [Armadillidium nasatum]